MVKREVVNLPQLTYGSRVGQSVGQSVSRTRFGLLFFLFVLLGFLAFLGFSFGGGGWELFLYPFFNFKRKHLFALSWKIMASLFFPNSP
jgi:hypothetical protein